MRQLWIINQLSEKKNYKSGGGGNMYDLAYQNHHLGVGGSPFVLVFCKRGFLCVIVVILELTVQTRLASNSRGPTAPALTTPTWLENYFCFIKYY